MVDLSRYLRGQGSLDVQTTVEKQTKPCGLSVRFRSDLSRVPAGANHVFTESCHFVFLQCADAKRATGFSLNCSESVQLWRSSNLRLNKTRQGFL